MTARRFRKPIAMPSLPIDRQLRYGTGIQYEINRDVTAGAAWEFMDAGPAPYSNTRGPLAGTCKVITRPIILTLQLFTSSGSSSRQTSHLRLILDIDPR